MTISVVIPTLDEAGEVEGAIGSVLETPARDRPSPNSERPHGSTPMIEICAVDGGSRDATLERLRAIERSGAPLRTLCTTRAGRSIQLQRGLEVARGEVVLFLHADTRLPIGWLEAVADVLRDPAVVGGAFRFGFRPEGAARWHQRLQLCLVEWGARLRASWLGLPYGDQALFARRCALEALGGVPQVPLMEDLDLVRRLRRHGRLVEVALVARTSARRHLEGGVLRVAWRHAKATWQWARGADRGQIAAELRR